MKELLNTLEFLRRELKAKAEDERRKRDEAQIRAEVWDKAEIMLDTKLDRFRRAEKEKAPP